MEEIFGHLQRKMSLTIYNGIISSPAEMEEILDLLQWNMYLRSCNGRSIWTAAMEDVADQLQWKIVDRLQCKNSLIISWKKCWPASMELFTRCNRISTWPAPMEEVVDQLKWKKELTTRNGRCRSHLQLMKSMTSCNVRSSWLLLWKN